MIDDLKNVTPNSNNIVIHKFIHDDGRMVVTAESAENDNFFEVMAAGPGQMLPDGSRAKMFVQKGDIVVIGPAQGCHFNVGEKKMLIVSEDFVMARVGTVHTMKRRIMPDRIVMPEASLLT